MDKGRYDEIDANTEKMLFAEDLMRFVMTKTEWPEYQPHKVEKFRPFVRVAFTPVIFAAILHLERSMHAEINESFRRMVDNNLLTMEGFRDFVDDLFSESLLEGFEADVFLKLCVHLANMAFHFYCHGVKEAPKYAASIIASSLKYNMEFGGWDMLNNVAAFYAQKRWDFSDELSPDSESD